MEYDLGKALVLAFSALQALVCLFCYGDCLGGHWQCTCIYLYIGFSCAGVFPGCKEIVLAGGRKEIRADQGQTGAPGN